MGFLEVLQAGAGPHAVGVDSFSWQADLEARIKEGEAWSYRALNAQLQATESWHTELKRIVSEKRTLTWRARRAVG